MRALEVFIHKLLRMDVSMVKVEAAVSEALSGQDSSYATEFLDKYVSDVVDSLEKTDTGNKAKRLEPLFDNGVLHSDTNLADMSVLKNSLDKDETVAKVLGERGEVTTRVAPSIVRAPQGLIEKKNEQSSEEKEFQEALRAADMPIFSRGNPEVPVSDEEVVDHMVTKEEAKTFKEEMDSKTVRLDDEAKREQAEKDTDWLLESIDSVEKKDKQRVIAQAKLAIDNLKKIMNTNSVSDISNALQEEIDFVLEREAAQKQARQDAKEVMDKMENDAANMGKLFGTPDEGLGDASRGSISNLPKRG